MVFKIVNGKWIGGKHCIECCSDCSGYCGSDCPLDIEGSCENCEFKNGHKRENI